MNRYLSVVLFLLAALMLPLMFGVQRCSAWELSVNGVFEQRFTYLSRNGPNDLYGNAVNAQALLPVSGGTSSTTNPSSIGLSGPWRNMVRPEVISVKGSDGSWEDQRLWISVKANINPAVAIYSDVALQGWLNGPYRGGENWSAATHYAGWTRPSSRAGLFDEGYTVPVVRSLYLSAQTPLGTILWGRMPLTFGTGWAGFDPYSSVFNLLLLKAPYGPLTFWAGVSPHDSLIRSDPYDERAADLGRLTLASAVDRILSPTWNVLAAVQYDSGPLSMGFLNRTIYFNKHHYRPQGANTIRDDRTAAFDAMFLDANVSSGAGTLPSDSATGLPPVYGDTVLAEQVLFAKYTSGHWFINTEYAFQYLMAQRVGGRPISGWPKRWMAETGGNIGPLELRIAAFYSSGHDRNGGLLDVESSNGTSARGGATTQVGDSWNQWIMLNGAHSQMDPYSWLIGFYGGGNNGYDRTGYPTYSDFKAYAARVDYALASNLNMWASAVTAQRASNTGSWWGQYTGGLMPAPTRGANVPDNGLGHEINVGFDWILLENLQLNARWASWYPGRWFDHAYVDYSSRSTVNDPVSGIAKQINPGRPIDAIQAVRLELVVKF